MRSAGRGASHAGRPPPDVARDVRVARGSRPRRHASRARRRARAAAEPRPVADVPTGRGEQRGAGRERRRSLAVQRRRFRGGDVGVPGNHARVRRLRRARGGGGVPRGCLERSRRGSRRGGGGGGGGVRPRRGSHAAAVLVRIRGGWGQRGGGGVLPRAVPGARGDGRVCRGWRTRDEEDGEGRRAVHPRFQTEALDVRRRRILRQRDPKRGAAVHRRRARGDAAGHLTSRVRVLRVLLRRDEPARRDGGAAASPATVLALRSARTGVRVQRANRRAPRVSAQCTGRDVRPRVRDEHRGRARRR